MNKAIAATAACVLALSGVMGLTACTPSVNVNVNLAPIYAKLDVNVKVQLDEDVKSLMQQNPNLF